MKKRFLIFVILAIICISFCACKSRNADMPMPNDPPSYNLENNENIPERKIIYEVSFNIQTDDLNRTVSLLKSKVASDEWFDKESISDYSASFIVRIKSDRLNDFVNSLSEGGEKISEFVKTAKDISLYYQDTANKIASLNAEIARLNQLMENATVSELIEINKRLSEIQLELGNLQGTLNSYDSLINYSTVRIEIYNRHTYVKPTFKEKLKNVFSGAWIALGDFLKFIVIVLTACFPFIVLFAPVTAGIIILIKFLKKRKKLMLDANSLKLKESVSSEKPASSETDNNNEKIN